MSGEMSHQKPEQQPAKGQSEVISTKQFFRDFPLVLFEIQEGIKADPGNYYFKTGRSTNGQEKGFITIFSKADNQPVFHYEPKGDHLFKEVEDLIKWVLKVGVEQRDY